MPLYEYECDACHHRFERIQKYSDAPADVCPTCGKGPVKKLPSSPAIQFKGSGWYITDYARKSSTDAGKPDSGKTDSGTTTDTGSTSTPASPGSSDTSSKPADKTEKKS